MKCKYKKYSKNLINKKIGEKLNNSNSFDYSFKSTLCLPWFLQWRANKKILTDGVMRRVDKYDTEKEAKNMDIDQKCSTRLSFKRLWVWCQCWRKKHNTTQTQIVQRQRRHLPSVEVSEVSEENKIYKDLLLLAKWESVPSESNLSLASKHITNMVDHACYPGNWDWRRAKSSRLG